MICLLAASVVVPLGMPAITLRWTHSVEKIVWEEDWAETPAGLTMVDLLAAPTQRDDGATRVAVWDTPRSTEQ